MYPPPAGARQLTCMNGLMWGWTRKGVGVRMSVRAECESGGEKRTIGCFTPVHRSGGDVSPASGGTPADLQKWFDVGVGTQGGVGVRMSVRAECESGEEENNRLLYTSSQKRRRLIPRWRGHAS